MSYTKGEWKITERIDNYNIDSGLDYIADVPIKTNNAKANAQLISASPDLLEALKEAQSYILSRKKNKKFNIHDSTDFHIAVVMACAINKAEGK